MKAGPDRLRRVNELLKREIAEALFRVVTEDRFDVSAVTVTRVSVGSDLRSATVHVSIRDHQDERDRMIGLLVRHRGRLQAMINRDLSLKYTPRLHFRLDESIEKGDSILGVLARMEMDGTLPVPEPGVGRAGDVVAGDPAADVED